MQEEKKKSGTYQISENKENEAEMKTVAIHPTGLRESSIKLLEARVGEEDEKWKKKKFGAGGFL